jgi:hypothetical protein
MMRAISSAPNARIVLVRTFPPDPSRNSAAVAVSSPGASTIPIPS